MILRPVSRAFSSMSEEEAKQVLFYKLDILANLPYIYEIEESNRLLKECNVDYSGDLTVVRWNKFYAIIMKSAATQNEDLKETILNLDTLIKNKKDNKAFDKTLELAENYNEIFKNILIQTEKPEYYVIDIANSFYQLLSRISNPTEFESCITSLLVMRNKYLVSPNLFFIEDFIKLSHNTLKKMKNSLEEKEANELAHNIKSLNDLNLTLEANLML